MRFTTSIFLLLLFCNILFAQNDQDTPLTIEQLRTHVEEQLLETKEVFHWETADDYTVWSALMASDSLVSIGYKPAEMHSNIKSIMHTLDVQAPEWEAARENIIKRILELIEAKHGARFSREYLMPFGEIKALPYINIRIFDQDIVEEIRRMPEVRYFDVMSFDFEGEKDAIERDGVGCDPYDDVIAPADYVSITPQAVQSWHSLEHSVNQAWNNSNKGQGIWIAVIDSGASPNQANLNAEFAEGESAGSRVVEHYGFFNNDGWEDTCGHGTAMASLAAAPRGFSDDPAGVAYQSNLITYRGTDDVFINEAAEQDGTTACFIHAADDPRIHIISISLGTITTVGQVSDAVVYAHNQGKLIFAAAGTSFDVLNNYPVIFPAWMAETVAVTGVTDGAPREVCYNCHDGQEVDFVVCMERASNGNRGVTLGMESLTRGYVGGSSCATATMAGIGALVWGENPTWDKDDVLVRLIQSADYYPNRDNNFGWGKVDANAAVTAVPSTACSSDVSNEVMIQITNISFPAEDDGVGSENEWVIDLNGASYYFDVNEAGASGDPSSFLNVSGCGSVPIFVNLGMTGCGQSTLDIVVSSHENDSFSSNCSCDSGDDHCTTQTVQVDYLNNTFTHTSPAGDFVFTYTATCVAQNIPPVATVNGTEDLCQFGAQEDIVFQGSGGTAPYTISYTVNGGAIETITTVSNTATLSQGTTTQGAFVYQLIDVTDANNCTQAQSGSFTATVHPVFTPTVSNDSPVCEGELVTLTAMPATGTNFLFYLDANANSIYDLGEEIQVGAMNTYAATTFVNGDVVGVIVTNTDGCEAEGFTTLAILAANDPACVTNPCPGNYFLSGSQNNAFDYETNGTITSTQIVGASAIVDYDSGTCIELGPGFETVVGAVFHAFIEGCGGTE